MAEPTLEQKKQWGWYAPDQNAEILSRLDDIESVAGAPRHIRIPSRLTWFLIGAMTTWAVLHFFH